MIADHAYRYGAAATAFDRGVEHGDSDVRFRPFRAVDEVIDDRDAGAADGLRIAVRIVGKEIAENGDVAGLPLIFRHDTLSRGPWSRISSPFECPPLWCWTVTDKNRVNRLWLNVTLRAVDCTFSSVAQLNEQ